MGVQIYKPLDSGEIWYLILAVYPWRWYVIFELILKAHIFVYIPVF